MCYYSTDLSKAYRNSHGESGEKVSHGFAFEWYYCGKYFARADRRKHIESCSGVLGVVYNFNNQNLVTFEDNFKSKRDISFTLYFDFETTAPTDNYFHPEQIKMFVVSYALIACFHPKLKIEKIIVKRSYTHSINELTSISYLTADQLNFADPKLVSQLRDAALEVNARQCKNALAQMFTIETAFVKKTLMEWFNEKFKSQYLENDILIKNQYERKNPIDWKSDKCVICKMPLKIDSTNHKTPINGMIYGDFFYQI